MQHKFHGIPEVVNIEMVPVDKFKMGFPKSD